MSAAVALLCAALLILLGAGEAHAYRFVPDPKFGAAGVVDLTAGNPTGGAPWRAGVVRPGPAGSVYVVYSERVGPEIDECETRNYLARHLSNWALDPGFGSGGFVPLPRPNGCRYPWLEVDEEQRPVITWGSAGSYTVPSSTLAIGRFTVAGAADPSFGSGGLAFLQIPCPAGNGADPRGAGGGRLLLSFGCKEDESASGIATSPFRVYLARLGPNGALDGTFGAGGFLEVPLEAGWEPSWPVAVEPDGSAILSTTTRYVEGVSSQMRLLKVRPDGTFAAGYQARVERSLRRAGRLGGQPEQATDFVVRPKRLIFSARSDRGGWVMALRRDGSLDPEFSGDGFRRFAAGIRFIGGDRRGGLLVVGDEPNGIRNMRLFRLLADGNRDRTVGGPQGQPLRVPQGLSLTDLVSVWRGRPLFRFQDMGNCFSVQDCAEPDDELRRFRLSTPQRRRQTATAGRR